MSVEGKLQKVLVEYFVRKNIRFLAFENIFQYGGTPDFIILNDFLNHASCVIEVKSEFDYKVLGQLLRYNQYYSPVYLAVPDKEAAKIFSSNVYDFFFRKYGIGLIGVSQDFGYPFTFLLKAAKDFVKEEFLKWSTYWYILDKILPLMENFENYSKPFNVLLAKLSSYLGKPIPYDIISDTIRRLFKSLKPCLEFSGIIASISEQPKLFKILKYHFLKVTDFHDFLKELLEDIPVIEYVKKASVEYSAPPSLKMYFSVNGLHERVAENIFRRLVKAYLVFLKYTGK